MTTWMLIIFLAYSNGEIGSVALVTDKIDFGSRAECETARNAVKDAMVKDGGFRRSISICVKRSSFMLEPKAEAEPPLK